MITHSPCISVEPPCKMEIMTQVYCMVTQSQALQSKTTTGIDIIKKAVFAIDSPGAVCTHQTPAARSVASVSTALLSILGGLMVVALRYPGTPFSVVRSRS